MQRQPSSDQQIATPKSLISKKSVHLKKLQDMNIMFNENIKTFVMGISGGDCAGKKEMIQYMFDRKGEDWIIKESGERVTILHQKYFIKCNDGQKYSSEGTDWNLFYKKTLSLLIGNEIEVNYWHGQQQKSKKLKPAKLLVLEGSHIFMSSEATKNVSSLINLRVFIDSDSDIRLSRRVFQDTQENQKDLNWSINNYLQFIKPSYERQIEPTKQTSDIIIPHFGGGYDDHKKTDKQEYDTNIKIACNLILTHLKEEMKKYEEELLQQE